MNIEQLTATEADAVRVGRFLLETFAREHRFGSATTESINPDRSWDHIWRLLRDGAVWVVTDDDREIAGSISVAPTQLWWTDREYLQDGWFYVRPERRNTFAGLMLLSVAEDYARQKKSPLVIGVFNSGMAEIVGKLMMRRGYSLLGGTYVREV